MKQAQFYNSSSFNFDGAVVHNTDYIELVNINADGKVTELSALAVKAGHTLLNVAKGHTDNQSNRKLNKYLVDKFKIDIQQVNVYLIDTEVNVICQRGKPENIKVIVKDSASYINTRENRKCDQGTITTLYQFSDILSATNHILSLPIFLDESSEANRVAVIMAGIDPKEEVEYVKGFGQ